MRRFERAAKRHLTRSGFAFSSEIDLARLRVREIDRGRVR